MYNQEPSREEKRRGSSPGVTGEDIWLKLGFSLDSVESPLDQQGKVLLVLVNTGSLLSWSRFFVLSRAAQGD